MNARLSPVTLTRANLIGHNTRIAKTYGASVLGVTIALAYDRAMGCRDALLERVLMRARLRGLSGFQPTGDYRCSVGWHQRNAL